MGVGIAPPLRKRLAARFPYTWKDSGLKYLGISLTATNGELFAANYSPLLCSMSKSLQDISKIELLWSGRLAAFKMIVLPQLLYLFRTLPIPVPASFFSKLQSQLNNFLWQGRKARCSFKKLIASRRVGGIGHVLLKDYHSAAVLSQARLWFVQTHELR